MAKIFKLTKNIETTINDFAYRMVQDLTTKLNDNIESNLKSCIYTGIPNIKVEMNINGSQNTTNSKGEVSAIGKEIAFIEFGTGIKYNTSVGSSNHEWAMRTNPPSLIGTYGSGKGGRNAWGFYGSEIGNDPNSFVIQNKSGKSLVITRGIPSQFPLYNGYKDMKLYSQTKYECKE